MIIGGLGRDRMSPTQYIDQILSFSKASRLDREMYRLSVLVEGMTSEELEFMEKKLGPNRFSFMVKTLDFYARHLEKKFKVKT